MHESDRLANIEIDDEGLPAVTPEIIQERRVAVFDLKESNSFAIVGRSGRPVPRGPYDLRIGLRDGRVLFRIARESGDRVADIYLSLTPFKQIISDYFNICSSYYNAVKTFPVERIETIDMARRSIHDAGAELLIERFEGKATVDLNTARRLFTLICVLHPTR